MRERSRFNIATSASRIFKAVWKNPGICRIDIADLLGFDKSTVSNQVNNLIELGLLEEIEEGNASIKGGRKPIQLGVRQSFGRVLGMELQAGAWTLVELDLAGAILSEYKSSKGISPEHLAEKVAEIVEEQNRLGSSLNGPVLGIGIGAGGLIDKETNSIRFSVPLGILEPTDFSESLFSKVPVPCLIENDANCCAWGELAFGRNKEEQNFIYVLVEYLRDLEASERFGGLGVGCGLVLNNQVYTGSQGNAGEFRSAFCDGSGDVQFSLSKSEFARFASDSDIMARVCDELARNLAMFTNIMDLDTVIIGGDIEEMGYDLPEALRRRIEENLMYPVLKHTVIRYSSLGPRAVAYGAAGMMLEYMISNSLLPGLESKQ